MEHTLVLPFECCTLKTTVIENGGRAEDADEDTTKTSRFRLRFLEEPLVSKLRRGPPQVSVICSPQRSSFFR
jgi:hypothetical protein